MLTAQYMKEQNIEPMEVMRASEVAKLLHVTRQTVYNYVRMGLINGVWVTFPSGRKRLLLHKDSVAELISKGGGAR